MLSKMQYFTNMNIMSAASPIHLNVGDFTVIELVEQPTTGYRWHVESDTSLVLCRSEWLASEEAIGSAGTRQFTFHAVKAGNAQVRAKLWRAWVGDVSVTDTHLVVFLIH